MHTLKSILIALHNARPESAAQDLAVAWARRYDAHLTGVAIVDETVSEPTSVPIGGGAFREEERAKLLSEGRRLAGEAQEAFARKCRDAEVAFTVHQLAGVPHEIVASHVKGHDAAIVDHQGPTDYGPGESPADALGRLIKISPRPAVSAPAQYRPGDTVMVAYDGSRPAAASLFGLLGCGLGSLGHIRLLTVDDDSEESARRRAQSGLRYLRSHGIDAAFQPVATDRSASEVICEEAERQHSDLIVMGPHGRSALAEFFLGSVTKQVLADSTAPVLVYR